MQNHTILASRLSMDGVLSSVLLKLRVWNAFDRHSPLNIFRLEHDIRCAFIGNSLCCISMNALHEFFVTFPSFDNFVGFFARSTFCRRVAC